MARDYSLPAKKFPLDKVSLWLKAEGVQTQRGNKVSGWLDSGPNQLRFKPSNETEPPKHIKSAVGKYPAVQIKKGSFLLSEAVLGEKLLKTDTFVIYMLLNPTGALGNAEISDLFGWGDCQDKRLLVHLLFNDRFEFQFGNPTFRTHSLVIAEPVNHFNLAVFAMSPKALSIEVNGKLIASRKNHEKFSARAQTSEFKLGDSACGNGFDGEVAEFLIVTDLTSPEDVNSITQYFIKKYGLEF